MLLLFSTFRLSHRAGIKVSILPYTYTIRMQSSKRQDVILMFVIIGAFFLGCFLGITLMCLLQINRMEKEPDYESERRKTDSGS